MGSENVLDTCPLCGESDCVFLPLEDVLALRCSACDTELTREILQERMARCQRAIALLDVVRDHLIDRPQAGET